MTGYDLAQQNLASVVRNVERAVVLGKSFVEPWRQISHSIVQQQVHILMKNHPERVVRQVFGRKSDVINVFPRLKVAGHISAFALVYRLIWIKSLVVFENDYASYGGRIKSKTE